MKTAYRELMDEREQLVLHYLTHTPFEAPGFTTQQVADATGRDDVATRQALEWLYVHRRIGRQAPLLGGQRTYWMPLKSPGPLELKGPPDVGRQAPLSVAAAPVVATAPFNPTEVSVMLLVDECGDRGLSFAKTQLLGREAVAALQSLQRQGIIGVDIPHECWRFGIKGRKICDDYRRGL